MVKLSKAKMGILEFLWRINRPASLREISDGVGVKIRCVNMHIINLRRNNYVTKTGEGLYALTDLGKEALGFPRVNKESAERILSRVPYALAFHFYSELDKPLMIFSDSLHDFCDKIRSLDLKSIEFHMFRGDFEAWIKSLGDVELARRLAIIRESNLSGEELRDEIYRAVKSRCDELQNIISSL
ncbi:MAG: DUF5752 family protein [Candidatus Bathyarchaeia archaeon]